VVSLNLAHPVFLLDRAYELDVVVSYFDDDAVVVQAGPDFRRDAEL